MTSTYQIGCGTPVAVHIFVGGVLIDSEVAAACHLDSSFQISETNCFGDDM